MLFGNGSQIRVVLYQMAMVFHLLNSVLAFIYLKILELACIKEAHTSPDPLS